MFGPPAPVNDPGSKKYQNILKSRNYGFAGQVDSWVNECKDRLGKVMRQSIQDTIDDAQTTRAKGGRMPVDTGFLRASGKASLTGMPYGETRGERKEPNSYPSAEIYSSEPSVNLALSQFDIGMVLSFGWTAEYAQVREAYDGFLIGAVQNWQDTVKRNAEKLKRGSK